jgi:hypothetical protein
MNDFNYTDLESNGGLPLSQPWERIASKELSDISHYLNHGLFVNVQDLVDRLRQAADVIEEWAAENPEQPPVADGSLEVLGITSPPGARRSLL